MKHRGILGFLLLLLCGWSLYGQLSFSDLDLSAEDQLLFRSRVDAQGRISQSALFLTRLTDLQLTQLTVFPETMELLESANTLQIRNAFGTIRLPLEGALPQPIQGFPAISEGFLPLGGNSEGIAASPDGKWLLYLEQRSAGFGDLLLINVQDGSRISVAVGVERSGRQFPGTWSPDSRVFLYSKKGNLYYQTIATPPLNAPGYMDERYRQIGPGGRGAVSWGQGGEFFYLRGSTIFQVRGSELFARTVYESFLEAGTPLGQLPLEFNSEFDSFWMAPDSRSLLFLKGGRNLFYISLDASSHAPWASGNAEPGWYPLREMPEPGAVALPYLSLPWNTAGVEVLWSPQGLITILARITGTGQTQALAYRLNAQTPDRGFAPLPVSGAEGTILSGNGRWAIRFGSGGAFLYDYAAWQPRLALSTAPCYSALWRGDSQILLGNAERIELLSLGPDPSDHPAIGSRELICLSGADRVGFEAATGRILARSGDAWYATDGESPWEERSQPPTLREPSLVSGRYRVFLENQNSGPFSNLPMIRNTASVGTAPLLHSGFFARPSSWQSPSKGAQADASRYVALAFDCYDDATGLSQVLDALSVYGITATFFLNGDFIRRNPLEVKALSLSGHELGSLFYAPIDFTDLRYAIAEDFIARGLARNEDEFYQSSGMELSLLWHPPYYTISEEMVAAAARAGYVTVKGDVDPRDWVTLEDSRALQLTLERSAQIIDRIMGEISSCRVIPIRLGLLPGGRPDYLFNHIEALLDALLREGYSIVPVSAALPR